VSTAVETASVDIPDCLLQPCRHCRGTHHEKWSGQNLTSPISISSSV